MIEKIIKPFIISEQVLNKKEDIYAFIEFGKIVNRYSLKDKILSSNLWLYLKNNFNIKPENITVFCEIHSISEKFYEYIVKIDKPYRLVLYFTDVEKNKEENNRISELFIYFDSDSFEFVEKMVEFLLEK
jgi:hypothetical protein